MCVQWPPGRLAVGALRWLWSILWTGGSKRGADSALGAWSMGGGSQLSKLSNYLQDPHWFWTPLYSQQEIQTHFFSYWPQLLCCQGQVLTLWDNVVRQKYVAHCSASILIAECHAGAGMWSFYDVSWHLIILTHYLAYIRYCIAMYKV